MPIVCGLSSVVCRRCLRLHRMTNADIARVMREIAVFLDMDGVPFKPRAYEKVAYAIEAVDEPIAGHLPARRHQGGRGDSRRRQEHRREDRHAASRPGRCRTTKSCASKTPVDVAGLTAIEGLGPEEHQGALPRARRAHGRRSGEGGAAPGKIRDAAALRREERAEDPQGHRLPQAAQRPLPARRRAPADERHRSAPRQGAGCAARRHRRLDPPAQGDRRRRRHPGRRHASRMR